MSQAGPTRVLVIRFSSMGDVILTSPVVRALHAMLEGEVEVHFLTKSVFAAALTGAARCVQGLDHREVHS